MKKWQAGFINYMYEEGECLTAVLRKAFDLSTERDQLWLLNKQSSHWIDLHDATITLDSDNHLIIEGNKQEYSPLIENERIHKEHPDWATYSYFYTTPELLLSAKKRLYIPSGCVNPFKKSRFARLFGKEEWERNYKEILVTRHVFPVIQTTPFRKEYIMNDTISIIDYR